MPIGVRGLLAPDAESNSYDLAPINLVDCDLEDSVTALVRGQPIATVAVSAPIVLEDDNARRIFSYYAKRHDLWPNAKSVQACEIEDILKFLE